MIYGGAITRHTDYEAHALERPFSKDAELNLPTRPRGLRAATRKAAAERTYKLGTQLRRGETPSPRRMTQVAACPRSPRSTRAFSSSRHA